MREKPPSLASRILHRRTTNTIRGILDNWIPSVIRESRPFAWAVKRWLGPNALADFKTRAFRMSDQEFSAAYAALGGTYTERPADTTPAQADWILANIDRPGAQILEIGPGNGSLTRRLQADGYDVTALDLHAGDPSVKYVQGTVESIPLPDKSVEVIILSHVIEHVRSLTRAFLELERVARRRVIMVAPKQRHFRWTFDYHLHFFYSVDHLASHTHRGTTAGREIDGDLCLVWDVSGTPETRK